MNGVNWGIVNQGGNSFQNALGMGMQMGREARQAKQQNALMEQRQQQINLQTQQQQQAMQRETQTADLTKRAIGGDENAMTELAGINFERWSKIDANQKARATEEAKVFGQASLDLLQVPYEQRRGRFIEYARQFPEYADEIQEIAFLPAEQQDLALRGQVLDAQMIDKLHAMERQKAPNYQVIPEGATLVNTRDPNAIRQYQGQMQGEYSEGQTATNPQTGQKIVFRNGSWRPM